MGRVNRGDNVDTSGRIGRAEAIKKRCGFLDCPGLDAKTMVNYCRDMILGSKRRHAKVEKKGEDDDGVWSGFADVMT